MIPFAAVACLIRQTDGQFLEASLRDLSAIGFTLRLPRARAALERRDIQGLTLRFHRFRDSGECALPAGTFDWTREEVGKDWTVFRVETADPAFRALARQFMQDFQRYTALKEAQDDAALSQALTGYPAAGERVFPADLAARRQSWFASLTPDSHWAQVCAAVPELAVSLAEPRLWEAYLKLPAAAFSVWYWQTFGLAAHPLAQRRLTCIYIGNPTCPLLFPDQDTLLRLLDKARAEQVRPVLTLAPVPEGRLDAVLALLDLVTGHAAPPVELVVNDWGLAYLLRGRPGLSLMMGVLLNKRRKDVRMALMQGFDGRGELLAENAVHAPFFREALTGMGFDRISLEACGYLCAPSPLPGCLHLPFYQMNTAGRCTLRAACTSGDRGRQTPDDDCPGWCADHAFLYPEMLPMLGRYNTLYGLDARSLTDSAYLAQLTRGVDRLVVGLV